MKTIQNPKFNWSSKTLNDPPKRSITITDSVVDSIIDKFVERATFGKEKYNTDLDRQDLTLEDWLEHSIQEKLDDILYMQKALQVLREAKPL
jgi:hypothetical protein